jgi:hypothetical protein
VPLSFHEGSPEGLALTFDLGVFHNPKHLTLQAISGWTTFYIRNQNSIEGLVHFHLESGEAKSPYRSPFGSFIFSDSLTAGDLKEFIAFCENELKKKRVKSLSLKNRPESYSIRTNRLLTEALGQLNYVIELEETSAVIEVTDNGFDLGLHKSEKKRLRKCRENGLTFEQAALSQLQKIYVFLEACRKEKGYTLSMSYTELQKLANTFPDRIMLTTVIDRNKIVAANISIRVYQHVLYNFYHDHSSEYDSLSPVVLLNEGLYKVCQQNKIELLDLGTSMIDGKLNESLFAFKVNLGAKPSRKLLVRKTLTP